MWAAVTRAPRNGGTSLNAPKLSQLQSVRHRSWGNFGGGGGGRWGGYDDGSQVRGWCIYPLGRRPHALLAALDTVP